VGVLMPETEDDTQGLPKKPTPVSTSLPPFSSLSARATMAVLATSNPTR
jgi:hypothetical protein